jgi:chlorobactene glucosyltransferase
MLIVSAGAVLGLSFLLSVLLAVRLVKSLRRLTVRKQYSASTDAPSVSICIPARNETHALAECLERVLASDYPKLEILVLDDNSKDDTSLIIKSFAHAGVRFIPGQKLTEGWLGKNFALEQLVREASGTYVVFMDVDTFIQPHTISQLVGYSATEQKGMVSVLPRRNDVGRASVLFGTLRYFLQLANWWSRTPLVSSSYWMIRREVFLATLGGFAPYKDIVEPEGAIAATMKDTYACLLSNDELGIAYEKKWRSQVETSERLLFPLFGQTVIGGTLGILLLLLINAPIPVFVIGIISQNALLMATGLFVLLSYIALYAAYLRWFWQKSWWLGMFLWPYIALQEFVLLVFSMVGYVRGSVTWKGRSVRL